MTLPPATEPVCVHLEDVMPEFLTIRLGGGPGAEALVSFMFMLDFDDSLAADLALIGGTLKFAYMIVESGKPASQTERETLTKALRIQAALHDDGPDKVVAQKMAEEEGEKPPDLKGATNRRAMFSLADDLFYKHLPLAFKVVCNPAGYGIYPEDAALLLRDVEQLGRVLAAEPKYQDRDTLLAFLQRFLHQDAEKFLMGASILSWGEKAFDGDMTNVDALRDAMEQLGNRLTDLRMDES